VARGAKQVIEHMGNPKGYLHPMEALVLGLREELKELPFLEEDRQRTSRILYGHGEKKKPEGVDNR